MTGTYGNVGGTLDAETFAGLISGKLSAIVLNSFVDSDECARLAHRIKAHIRNKEELSRDAFTFIGTTIGEAHQGADRAARYFSEAPDTARLYRETLFPQGSPVARVVNHLLMAWPMGVRVAHFENQPFLPEVVRRWRGGGKAAPHIDIVDTPLLRGFDLRGRIAVNVYLEMSDEGGELEIWDQQDAPLAPVGGDDQEQGLTRERLGAPRVRLRPISGQAILFCSWRPHAVNAVTGKGERITSATFLGVPNGGGPLTMFA